MKALILILSLFASCFTYAQINVGSIEQVKLKAGKFKSSDLERLKKTTTVFIFRDEDRKNLGQLMATLTDAWDITPLEFVSYTDYSPKDYVGNYSFFTLGGFQIVRVSDKSGREFYTSNFYLQLWMPQDDKKLNFCRIELYPAYKVYEMADRYMGANNGQFWKYLYTKSTLYNWNLVYLKNALQFVNKHLKNSQTHWLCKSEEYAGLSKLRGDTLYVPEYTLIKFDKVIGDESARHEVEVLFKKYPYPYKVVSIDELAKKLENDSKPIYYLSYIKSGINKYISVINGKTGDILYTDYSAMFNNIKDKNLGKLAKAID